MLPEIKIKVVEEYLAEKRSVNQTAYELNVSEFSVEEWIRKYKHSGVDGLKYNSKNRYYSAEVKLKATTDYINGRGSLYDICAKYKISTHSILQKWIKRYNSHKTFKSHGNRGDKIMTNGRKTTYDERIEIVAFALLTLTIIL